MQRNQIHNLVVKGMDWTTSILYHSFQDVRDAMWACVSFLEGTIVGGVHIVNIVNVLGTRRPKSCRLQSSPLLVTNRL